MNKLIVLTLYLVIFGFSVFPNTVLAQSCSVPPEKLSEYSRCLVDVRNSNGQFTEKDCDYLKTSCTAKPGSVESVFGKIETPSQISGIPIGTAGINHLIRLGINLLFIVGAVSTLFFVIWGAIDYISAGTRKEGAAEARKKITYALIGLVLLGLSFFVVRLVGNIVGLGELFQF